MSVDEVIKCLPDAFRVTGPLDGGRGGQGQVFRGEYNGRDAAIKVYFANPMDDGRRFEREILALKELDNKHLVCVYDSVTVEFDGASWFVVAYEFHGGGTLEGIAGGIEDISIPALAGIGRDIAEAIDTLWTHRRIVHRDIKPANIIRSEDGYNVLVDLGIARHLDHPTITPTGMWLGTPGYMAPEQWLGTRDLTCRTDIFSLGVTLFEIASKSHPYEGNQSLIGNKAPRLDIEHFPESLARFIESMLETRAYSRPLPKAAMGIFEPFIREG